MSQETEESRKGERTAEYHVALLSHWEMRETDLNPEYDSKSSMWTMEEKTCRNFRETQPFPDVPHQMVTRRTKFLYLRKALV